MKTIIVTGCFGFIGKHITKSLVDQGVNVIGIDKLSYASNDKFTDGFIRSLESKNNFTFIKEDINNLKNLPDANFIIHLASSSHVDNSIINQSSFVHDNILGTEKLLQLIREKYIFNRPTLIHISTDEIYGDAIDYTVANELTPPNPSSPYSASKSSAEQLVMGYGKTFDIKYCILRLTNNYGLYQYPEKLISKTLRHFARDEKSTLYGDGTKNSRYWLYTEDTVNAINALLNNMSLIKNDIFNISGDVIKTNREVVEEIIKSYYKVDVVNDIEEYCNIVPYRKAEDTLYHIDDSKFRSLTGWKPLYNDLNLNIKNIVEWHKDSIAYWN